MTEDTNITKQESKSQIFEMVQSALTYLILQIPALVLTLGVATAQKNDVANAFRDAAILATITATGVYYAIRPKTPEHTSQAAPHND